MFKRPRLSTVKHLVNALSVSILLFLASACQDPPEKLDIPPSQHAKDSSNKALMLPAVWNTSTLGAKPTSAAIAGALGSTIAVTYQDGSLQLFNFEGERITNKADLDVKTVANGRFLMLSGTPVTLFPGISTSGDLQLYIHGGNLPEPLAYAFDIDQIGSAIGLCTEDPRTPSDGVMRLAYWTHDAPSILHSGRIVEIGETLVFLADEPVEAKATITACALEPTGAKVFTQPIKAASILERNGKRHLITLDIFGNITLLLPDGRNQVISIKNGLSVNAPELASDMAATGDARGGGYPGGLLILAGPIGVEDYRLVLIDPSQLTLAPLSVPALSSPLSSTPNE